MENEEITPIIAEDAAPVQAPKRRGRPPKNPEAIARRAAEDLAAAQNTENTAPVVQEVKAEMPAPPAPVQEVKAEMPANPAPANPAPAETAENSALKEVRTMSLNSKYNSAEQAQLPLPPAAANMELTPEEALLLSELEQQRRQMRQQNNNNQNNQQRRNNNNNQNNQQNQ